MTKIRSIIGHRVDYKGVGVMRGQQHIPSKNQPKCPPPPPPGEKQGQRQVFSKAKTNDTRLYPPIPRSLRTPVARDVKGEVLKCFVAQFRRPQRKK